MSYFPSRKMYLKSIERFRYDSKAMSSKKWAKKICLFTVSKTESILLLMRVVLGQLGKEETGIFGKVTIVLFLIKEEYYSLVNLK